MLKHKVKIIFIGGIILIVGFIFAKQFLNSTIEMKVQTIVSNGRPLLWLDEQFLLLGIDHQIVKYDTKARQVVDIVSDVYYPYGMHYDCFSPEGGVFNVEDGPEIKQGKSGTKVISHVFKYRSIHDWSKPKDFKELDNESFKRTGGWDINILDCNDAQPFRTLDHEQLLDDGFKAHSTADLMKTIDGVTMTYCRDDKVMREIERMVLIEKEGIAKRVNLGRTTEIELDVRSSFDRTANQYFWYLETSNFNIKSKVWPLKGWWVSRDGDMIREIVIPSGPWVKEFSFFYRMKSFSCGPACYSHMKIYAGDGQLYFHVWGKAIDKPVAGIYRFNVKEQEWKKLISGKLDNGLILSPNGCQISYAVDGKVNIMNVCEMK